MQVSNPDGNAIIERHAAFMQGDVAIDLATRDPGHRPFLAIGLGCRASAAAGRITVLLNSRHSAAFLKALVATRAVAVVFGRPSSHRCIQVKGHDAAVETPLAADRRLIRAYREAFAANLESIGFPRHYTAVYLGDLSEPLAAIAFTPASAFEQTPGPAAGTPLA